MISSEKAVRSVLKMCSPEHSAKKHSFHTCWFWLWWLSATSFHLMIEVNLLFYKAVVMHKYTIWPTLNNTINICNNNDIVYMIYNRVYITIRSKFNQ